VATHYFNAMTTQLIALRAWWEALKVYIPSVVSIQPVNAGDIIDDASGTITGSWGIATVPAVTCTGGGVYAAPAGMQVRWQTQDILDGRRVRGRTFVVPLVTGAYQTDGTLLGTASTAFQTASDTFVSATANTFCVWHRPRPAVPADGSRPAVAYRPGGHAVVTAASVPDRVAVLRTRRA
jgi:hypothetical protein